MIEFCDLFIMWRKYLYFFNEVCRNVFFYMQGCEICDKKKLEI